jgi:ERO1-like protein beta
LQTNGYGTALKVLFEFDENDSSKDPPLRRTELVALINTMDRLSHSLSAIKDFRRMVDDREGVPKTSASALPEADKGVLKTKRALEDSEEAEPAKTGIEQDSLPDSDETKPLNIVTGEDEVPDFRRNWNSRHMTVWEEAKMEFFLVYRVFMYVLWQWTQLPGRL